MRIGPAFNNAAHLRATIKQAGWPSAALARQAGNDRTTVFYWLRKQGPLNGYAPNAFRRAFLSAGVNIGSDVENTAQPTHHKPPLASLEAFFMARLETEQTRLAMRAIRCGAIRTNGKPCPAKPVAGKKRCKFHGGLSTGPRTPEGRQRIAEAQRKRWRKTKERWVSPPVHAGA